MSGTVWDIMRVTNVSLVVLFFDMSICFQCLASNNSEYVDLSALALELQKVYRQVLQSFCSQKIIQ